jgi:pimeloyl-ACP methyl ester carboxylesterase
MVKLMDKLGHPRFAVVGTDTGMPIGYALAADHPDRVERLAVAEAVVAGVTPSPPLILPPPVPHGIGLPAGRLRGLVE